MDVGTYEITVEMPQIDLFPWLLHPHNLWSYGLERSAAVCEKLWPSGCGILPGGTAAQVACTESNLPSAMRLTHCVG